MARDPEGVGSSFTTEAHIFAPSSLPVPVKFIQQQPSTQPDTNNIPTTAADDPPDTAPCRQSRRRLIRDI